ncbi:hypothetical protein GUITHDRAFT_142355 [Guillardia theta CCMP2712]|uniref:N-acetyltransferase domain-containing protein n=1 Tax=Guillardia theta (strain CCMP2712) TaxID=905079 RepID=L1IXJ7_GUITC|nr:hypothetical protein GUITHDRAFT_142355 [Guillardia theta CCMP2712]EKX40956.1 hypothetical protein GUITHDRAFT_142355 [Guillardia theta CCMP2712]|eukprot:XP_005827936.1 hypothetical protein GUITHDRAFT_142355 [Guillardia theta CCMP2712]
MAEREEVVEELRSCSRYRMEEEEEKGGRTRMNIGPEEGGEDRVWKFSGILRKVGVGAEAREGECFLVRTVKEGDEKKVLRFLRRGLSEESRRTFAPYPYEQSDEELEEVLRSSIRDSVLRRSLSLILLRCHHREERKEGGKGKQKPAEMREGEVVTHGFLWASDTALPELGVAVADDEQGKGLGAAMMSVLVGLGRSLGKEAIELTTMLDNGRAKSLYEKCQFITLGTILNPLGSFEGRAIPSGISEEYQMVRILREENRKQVEQMLKDKRSRAVELFGALREKQLVGSSAPAARRLPPTAISSALSFFAPWEEGPDAENLVVSAAAHLLGVIRQSDRSKRKHTGRLLAPLDPRKASRRYLRGCEDEDEDDGGGEDEDEDDWGGEEDEDEDDGGGKDEDEDDWGGEEDEDEDDGGGEDEDEDDGGGEDEDEEGDAGRGRGRVEWRSDTLGVGRNDGEDWGQEQEGVCEGWRITRLRTR